MCGLHRLQSLQENSSTLGQLPYSLVPNPTSDSPPYALALHTTTPELGIALAPLSAISAPQSTQDKTQVWNLGHALSTQLHVKLQAFIQPLSWSDISLIAVARGPGGFTGTRVGIVAARTLAQQLDLPLFAVSSLEAAAWQAILEHPDAEASPTPAGDIAVEMPARRGQVFAAVYSVQRDASDRLIGLVPKLPDTVMDRTVWEEMRQQCVPCQQFAAEGGLGSTVNAVLQIALAQWHRGDRPHWSEALPFYGQSPV